MIDVRTKSEEKDDAQTLTTQRDAEG